MEHSNELVRPIDPCTFGKGSLANSLASILNERNDRYLANKVGGLTADYQKTLKEIDSIENDQVFEYTLGLVRADFLLKAARYSNETALFSHLRNFIVARHRNLLRNRKRMKEIRSLEA